ncbi:4-hydroxy-tetrahydrodipicolinate reductase [bacterium]|nr:4-hydroxy-tetrahydrodipicolinate reductase [bacterium]
MALKLALVGFGRMGKTIARQAAERGFEVAATYASDTPLSTHTLSESADVYIDFSVASATLGNIKLLAQVGKPIVIGTTGWHSQLDEAKEVAQSSDIGVIHASNFSIGVNLFFRIVEHAARLFDRFDDFDPFIQEVHHSGKRDSPSGTALTMGHLLIKHLHRKREILHQNPEGIIKPEYLHITSSRSGKHPGTHSLVFDSLVDSIEIKHTARSRLGFVDGALDAAEWIIGKTGFFTMDDYLEDRLR